MMRKILYGKGTAFTRRPIEMSDFDAISELESNPTVMQYTSMGKAQTYSETKARLARHLSVEYDDPNLGIYGYFDKDRLVTWVMLIPIDGKLMLGYMSHPDYWGQGITSALISDFIEQLPAHIGAQRIYALVEKKNTASIRLVERIGFTLYASQELEDKNDELREYCLGG
ncbi:hypothetical protein CS022_23300 [Veronia nyctiphanis]|uniref:N-acetyltransferase domain-containing protein n=1 Tax=Veronia nyctiphanis TaxID=1278244 RepID=A0A4Q0YJ58_9GAMM|nr:GNAT family N-acetyltransferase [Veronia nyctiphanis]RXJ70405.1 hypothetical protein CS022_23300 [Veronia nyctiphanis]